MALPSLEMVLEVSNLDGSESETFPATRDRTDGAARLGNFTTKLQTGFEHLGGTEMYRDMRKRFNSPRVFQTTRVKGLGETAWEGEATSVPLSRADSLEADGYYGALKDVSSVSEIYVSRDVSQWHGTPLNRRAELIATYSPADGQVVDGSILTELSQPTWTAGALPNTEMWYTAPAGVGIGNITAAWKHSDTDVNGADYVWAVYLSGDDAPATSGDFDSSGDLQAAGPGTVGLTATESNRRFAFVQLLYGAAYGTDDSLKRGILWTPTIYGDHGLASIYASEVVKHAVSKYCPILTADDSTVDATAYAIGHLVFEKASVADVIERCNAFHLWEIAVWENRRVHFKPSRDRTDYDYLVSIFRGDTLDPAPMAIDDGEPCNGIWVYYTDVLTGRAERVGPLGTSTGFDSSGDALLYTTNPTNPCNRADRNRFPSIDIGYRCTRADAILLGSLQLAERQIKSYAGSGTARAYVRNRAGQWVPSWKIRAGDRVKYTHEDTIRRVYATSYNYRDCTNALTFEKPASTVAGINERIQNALQAGGLG